MPPRPPQGEARRELLPLLARRQAGPSRASCLIYRPLRKAWLFSSGGWRAPEPLKCQACLVPISRPPPTPCCPAGITLGAGEPCGRGGGPLGVHGPQMEARHWVPQPRGLRQARLSGRGHSVTPVTPARFPGRALITLVFPLSGRLLMVGWREGKEVPPAPAINPT